MGRRTADAVILCGGLGTRLREVLPDQQKTMADISERPFLEILVRQLKKYGFTRIIFCTGYKGESVREYFESKNDGGLLFFFSQEKTPLGTAGALKVCEPYLEASTFLMMNGDSFCPVDLEALVSFQNRHGGIGTVAVTPALSRADGGYMNVGSDNLVLSFGEKEYSPLKYLNAGIYVFQKKIFDFIPKTMPCSLEKDVFPSILSKNFYAYPTREMLYDIGTPERLAHFKQMVSSEDFLKYEINT